MSDDHNTDDTQITTRWRLILGNTEKEQNTDAEDEGMGIEEQLTPEQKGMDETLEAIYESNDRKGGLGSSSPRVNKWLGDIRKYFPKSVVQVMQRDALERLDLKRMLFEPELLSALEPDVHLVGTLLSLKQFLPAKTHETARAVVEKVVRHLENRLELPMKQALAGALHRAAKTNRPRHQEIDWHATIRKNLKHYQPEQKTIIPEVLRGYGKRTRSLRTVILLVDQSGSMAESVVYASVFSAVMASVRSVTTHIVFFDTAVVDVTPHLSDPIELLFSVQLGGGTDIGKAIKYGQTLVGRPNDTICLLISDLYEGSNQQVMHQAAAQMVASGVQFIALLALSDSGKPAFDQGNAEYFRSLEIPTFACTPDVFPEVMAAAIKRENLQRFG
jgi:Mg-chelatase subunit ChlD